MVALVPIAALCPTCSSAEIFYSCHTSCCFNHVCNDCRTTFELATDSAGEKLQGDFSDPGERDTSLPMAPCGACESVDVYGLKDSSRLVCVSCRELLTLRFEKIRPDQKG